MIVRDKTQDLLNYLEDTSNVQGKASLLYLPQNNQEVLESVKDCLRSKIPFT